jgi:hypothetical protein
MYDMSLISTWDKMFGETYYPKLKSRKELFFAQRVPEVYCT